jgi:hypothetical protein
MDAEQFRGRTPYFDVLGATFRIMLGLPRPEVNTKVFVGSLLLHQHAYEEVSRTKNRTTEQFNRRKFADLVNKWANPPRSRKTISRRLLAAVLNGRVWVVCLESIESKHAKLLDLALKDYDPYLGSANVADSYTPHAILYTHGLVALGRFWKKRFFLFWDGFSEDSCDEGARQFLGALPFESVEFESLHGRYSIFDRHHSPQVTLDSARTRAYCERPLASTVERVFVTLGDGAPELGQKLHAALEAYEKARSEEQLSHVALSCRRIIEYVADQLFPPKEGGSGRKLDKQAYRNRLLAFADEARHADTVIDLVVASTTMLAEQVERLDEAINKGVHARAIDAEVRRCLIRTILLLDDLASLRAGRFEMRPKLDFDGLVRDGEDAPPGST